MRVKIILLFIILMVFLIAHNVFACKCLINDDPIDELANRDLVFTGRVTRIKEVSGDTYKVTVELSKVFKGIVKGIKTINVQTSMDQPSCGYVFKKGEEYLVYASCDASISHEFPDYCFASVCSRTKKIVDAAEDLGKLEKYITMDSSKNENK